MVGYDFRINLLWYLAVFFFNFKLISIQILLYHQSSQLKWNMIISYSAASNQPALYIPNATVAAVISTTFSIQTAILALVTAHNTQHNTAHSSSNMQHTSSGIGYHAAATSHHTACTTDVITGGTSFEHAPLSCSSCNSLVAIQLLFCWYFQW